MHPRLSLKNITKRYPGIVANDGINMDIAPGEVLAVLGENGAGKSTLMKIIYGSVRPDEGSLEFDGRPLDVSSPAEARASGIAMVHQHFALFDTLTVAENVALGLPPGRSTVEISEEVKTLGEKYGLDSPEGRGVMGMYICGTVFGALWISILAGVVAGLDIFHPHSLAMGAGIGSASMMAAGTGSIIAAYPEAAETVGAYAAAANLMTSVLGIYFALFISLPVTVKIYELVTGDKRAA